MERKSAFLLFFTLRLRPFNFRVCGDEKPSRSRADLEIFGYVFHRAAD